MTEDLKQLIGTVIETRVSEIEKGAIRKYADAVEDANPLYWNEQYAKKSKFGALVAPPGFFGWPAQWPKAGPLYSKATERVSAALTQSGYTQLLDGSVEFEFFYPIKAGDTLTCAIMLKGLTERKGALGGLALVELEITYTNQDGEVAAKARHTFIYR